MDAGSPVGGAVGATADVVDVAAAEVAETVPQAPVPVVQKKARKTGLAKAEADIELAKEALDKKLAQHQKMLLMYGGIPAPDTERARKVHESDEKILKYRENLTAAQAKLGEATVRAKAKEDAAKVLAEKALLAAEKTATYSPEGMVFLVATKFKHEKAFRNTKDRVLKVWDEVKAEVDAAIAKGDYPASDMRKKESLVAKFSELQGLFRRHCSFLQAAIVSGAEGEKLEEANLNSRHRNCTTDTFMAYDQAEAPMSVPPFNVNDGNAAIGGEANLLKKVTSPGISDTSDEVNDEEEEDDLEEEEEDAEVDDDAEEEEAEVEDAEAEDEEEAEEEEEPPTKKAKTTPVHPPASSHKKHRPAKAERRGRGLGAGRGAGGVQASAGGESSFSQLMGLFKAQETAATLQANIGEG